MSDLLKDEDNLKLLEELVSGNAVSINISELSSILGKHRHTIKKQVENIFAHRILDPPIVPFLGLYKVYPLLAVVNLEIPNCNECGDKYEEWVKEDPQIFAAFRTRQEEFNTMLFTYHKDITSYQLWMASLPSILKLKYGVSDEHSRFNSSTSYFSNQLILKYNPSTGINLMEKDFREKGELNINGYDLSELDLKIIRCLVTGKGIKLNQILLCEKTGLNRKTVDKRISLLTKEGVIGEPLCRFPNFFVPPSYILTFSLVELKMNEEKVIRETIMDPHIPIVFQTFNDRYNILIFGNYRSVEERITWEEEYRNKFPDAFGASKIIYLSPQATIFFSQQTVSLCYIRRRMRPEITDNLVETIRSLGTARARVLYDLPYKI